jgi:hypothetical protein
MLDEYQRLKVKFENHILTEILNTEKIKVFEFRNVSGTGNNYQRWIIDRGTLIVTGDNYNSIYRWNDNSITLQFLATCNLDYFSQKCLADKDGESQKTFDSDDCIEYLKSIAAERIYDEQGHDIDCNEETWYKLELNEKFNLVTEKIKLNLDIDDYDVSKLFYCENEYEAYKILNNSENEFMFGIDGWEYCSGITTLTMIPKIHLTALMVAYEKYPNAF